MKTPPQKYFIGKLDKVKRGSPYRIFRRRRNKLMLTIDEVQMKHGFKRMKSGYSKQSLIVYGQAAARAEKKRYDRAWRLEGSVK